MAFWFRFKNLRIENEILWVEFRCSNDNNKIKNRISFLVYACNMHLELKLVAMCTIFHSFGFVWEGVSKRISNMKSNSPGSFQCIRSMHIRNEIIVTKCNINISLNKTYVCCSLSYHFFVVVICVCVIFGVKSKQTASEKCRKLWQMHTESCWIIYSIWGYLVCVFI